MPGLDGTGPKGKGPLSGRRRGKCVDKSETTETHEIKNTDENSISPPGSGQYGERRRWRRMRRRRE